MSSKKKPARLDGIESKFEYKQYIDKLSPEDKKWVREFYAEYYASTISGDRKLTSDEAIKEANRNYNCLRTDALELAGRGKIASRELEVTESDIMEAASDEWEWRDAYAIGGYELACQYIFDHAIKHVTEHGPKEYIFAQFYIKMESLRKYRNQEYNQRRKK